MMISCSVFAQEKDQSETKLSSDWINIEQYKPFYEKPEPNICITYWKACERKTITDKTIGYLYGNKDYQQELKRQAAQNFFGSRPKMLNALEKKVNDSPEQNFTKIE